MNETKHQRSFSKPLMYINISIFILIKFFFTVCLSSLAQAQTNLNYTFSPKIQANLIQYKNESLAVNNRTLVDQEDKQLNSLKDDWTLDRVEYDLIEFLQDMGARYKLNNKTELASQFEEVESVLESKTGANTSIRRSSEDAELTSQATEKRIVPTRIPELSTSLAPEDHDIGESTWQYGIFDRFTRSKTSTSRPSTSSDSNDFTNENKLDVKSFNSDECGLRTYVVEEQSVFSPQEFEAEGLKQRRQKLSLSPVDRKKLDSLLAIINKDQERDEKRSTLEYDGASYDVPPQSQAQPSDSLADSEFNLASRRLWLQQQLGNTLQMLGFAPNQTDSDELYNETLRSNFNFRENMMKRFTHKLGKASNYATDKDSDSSTLIARQDEMKLEARVIGGTDARLGDSPWSVSLQALVSRPGTGAVEYRHYCGGTIISENYVLTAAHCLDFMVGRESRLFVVIGDLNWRMSAASMYGRRFGIEKLIIHSGYKSTAFGHDIGLIKTKESMKPLKVNGRYIVNSVCLPNKGVEHSGEAELVGWGLFSNRNEMADSLQIADVPILPRPLCVDLYKRRTGLIQWLIGIELITEKQVCAGTFGRGICQGDSGSALVVNEKLNLRHKRQLSKILRQSLERDNRNTRATIIGVVAFGGIRRCSYQSLPGVYMQTSKYMDWILPRI